MLGDIFSAGLNFIGGALNRDASEEQFERNIAMQQQFARSGIQMRVNDARMAGIHPLYALGAQTPSFSPVSVGTSDFGTGIQRAGQDLGRAINAAQSAPDRNLMTSLQLERAGLENDLLRSQIARNNSAQVGPPMPSLNERYAIDGQSGTPSLSPPVGFGAPIPGTLVTTNPQKREAAAPGQPHQTPASVPEVTFSNTSSGGYAPMPSQSVKESMEDLTLVEIPWLIRNNILPSLGIDQSPPPFPAKEGFKWTYSILRQQYVQVPRTWHMLPDDMRRRVDEYRRRFKLN